MEKPVPEQQGPSLARKLNWLRAGVLGANDGVVTTSGLIFGVAGAAAPHSAIVLAGVAAIAAGAMSMAVGEYVSVSSQRAVEKAELAHEGEELATDPAQELDELAGLLEESGIEPALAGRVAVQLTRRDALAAHARMELGIDPAAIVKPWQAALASMVAFLVGGLIPLTAMLAAPRSIELWISGAAVAVALALSGATSARLGRTPMLPSVLRSVIGGILAMAVTYGVGAVAGARL